MKTLCEGQFGHGAKHSKVKSFLRKKYRKATGRHLVANAAAPFNWNTGVDNLKKIGGIKIKNQGQSFSCGRQAGAYAQYILRKLRGIDEGEISARSGYGLYCAKGGGMSASQVETNIGAWGANLESAVPSYDIHGVPLSENDMEDTSWLTPKMVQDALKRAGYTPYDVSIDMESIATAINNSHLVMWIIRGQNNGTWLSANPKPPSKSNPGETWNHWMCVPVAGMKNNSKTFTALNSWGINVGNAGTQDFTSEYINSGNILEVIAFAYDNQTVPTSSIWAAVRDWFRSQWQLAQSLA